MLDASSDLGSIRAWSVERDIEQSCELKMARSPLRSRSHPCALAHHHLVSTAAGIPLRSWSALGAAR
jgi:hypothetical protein